ncbi:Tad domain-containing protein [Nocardia sp. NPDC006044]|uniref:Tad domain-containing protein n=1 Tax=Nocardia sp. NPDC006044 TaxID=3364306 RepID=UPI0036A4B9AF
MSPRHSDEASFLLWWAIVMVAGIAVLGLVVDGGGKIKTGQRAQAVAEEAARAGAQGIVIPLAKEGKGVVLNPITAVSYAEQYLQRVGVAGTAVPTGPTTIEVDTTMNYQPKILGMFGIGPQTMTGHASARINQTNTGLPGER